MTRSNLGGGFAGTMIGPVMHELQLYNDYPVFASKKDDKPLTNYEQFCPTCKRRFMTEDGLARHIQRKHSG